MSKRKELRYAKGYCDVCDRTYGNPYTKCHICGARLKIERAWKKRTWKKEVEIELQEQ